MGVLRAGNPELLPHALRVVVNLTGDGKGTNESKKLKLKKNINSLLCVSLFQ